MDIKLLVVSDGEELSVELFDIVEVSNVLGLSDVISWLAE